MKHQCHGVNLINVCTVKFRVQETRGESLMARCKACPERKGQCRTCKGTGEVYAWSGPRKCSKCGGDGVCSGCNGSGYNSEW